MAWVLAGAVLGASRSCVGEEGRRHRQTGTASLERPKHKTTGECTHSSATCRRPHWCTGKRPAQMIAKPRCGRALFLLLLLGLTSHPAVIAGSQNQTRGLYDQCINDRPDQPKDLFDAVLVVHSKDSGPLQFCVKSILCRCAGVGKIWIVSDKRTAVMDGMIEAHKASNGVSRVQWFDEKGYPFSIAEFKRVMNGGNYGWYFQQFLKLYAGRVLPNVRDYLIVDADLFFYHNFEMAAARAADGTVTSYYYNMAGQNHGAYFDLISRMTGGEVTVGCVSGEGIPNCAFVCFHVFVCSPVCRQERTNEHAHTYSYSRNTQVTRVRDYLSGVVHFMLFKLDVTEALLKLIEKHDPKKQGASALVPTREGTHLTPTHAHTHARTPAPAHARMHSGEAWKAILAYVDPKVYNCLSEYELYFNYAL